MAAGACDATTTTTASGRSCRHRSGHFLLFPSLLCVLLVPVLRAHWRGCVLKLKRRIPIVSRAGGWGYGCGVRRSHDRWSGGCGCSGCRCGQRLIYHPTHVSAVHGWLHGRHAMKHHGQHAESILGIFSWRYSGGETVRKAHDTG